MAAADVETLYAKRMLIGIKCTDRNERKSEIQVALEMHTNSSGIHKKELVMRLTDEADLFFLYTLRVSEEDFQSLRAQQGLLVDFGAFPQHLVHLLDMCCQEEHKDQPKFILELLSSGSSSVATMNIIETNPFKHLTHLALKFLPGQDADVKKFLAHCLKNLKEENVVLRDCLARTESDLSCQLRQAREALSSRTMELDSLKRDWASHSKDLGSQHTQALNAEREKALQMQTELQHRMDAERRQMEQEHTQVISRLETRLEQADRTCKELTERKFQNEAAVRELRSRLSALEEESQRDKQELANVRQQNASLETRLHEQEKAAAQMRTRLAVTEQEVKDKEQVMQRTCDLLGTEQSQKRKYEEEMERKKRHIGKLEASVKTLTDELVKGNEIIKKLQGDIKNYHTKLKLRTQVTTEQEKLLVEKNKDMEDLKKELNDCRQMLRDREDENKKLNESLESTLQKLEESKQLLKTNENVINWLNRQITDTQLSSTRHGPFELPSGGSLRHAMPIHNFDSAPSSIQPRSDTTSVHSQPSPLSATSSQRPQYQPRTVTSRPSSHLPVNKSSPLSVTGTIPEESHTPLPSPALTSSAAANSTSNSEPALDNKYLSQAGQPPVRRAAQGPTSRAHSAPLFGPLKHTTQPSSLPSKSSPPPAASTIPLASSYFPAKSRVS